MGSFPGTQTGFCSHSGNVIVEELHLAPAVTPIRALGLALAELPADAQTVYDQQHDKCRIVQMRSLELSQSLGSDDPTGVASIDVESAITEPSNIDVVRIDLLDALNQDSGTC